MCSVIRPIASTESVRTLLGYDGAVYLIKYSLGTVRAQANEY